MKKILNKLLKIFIASIMIMQNLSAVVIATTEITKANLKKDHKITTNIQYFNKDGTWHDIICNYICYIEDGKKYPAYCVKHGVNGVDEVGGYTVEISELLSDEKIWRTIVNGYPYKTPEQLGVETEDDAYVATKQAVNSVMLNRDVKSFYKGKNSKGKKIVDAIYKISEIGKNGTQTKHEADLKISKSGKFSKYNSTWYFQEYKVNSNVNISEYSVESIKNFPKDTYVADEKGNEKTQFKPNENFRIMIKKENIIGDISGVINVKGKCKTYPIYFGKAPNSKVQDYAITYKEYEPAGNIGKMEEHTNISSIQLIKKDEESNKPIKNVKYQLTDSNNKIIKTKVTDENGKIVFDNLYSGNYTIQEVETDANYILDKEKHNIKIGYDETIIKELTNKHKKGNLKIIKVDKDNNDITLGGIEFDLIDSNNNIVAHLITDADGKAQINNINIGNYTLKETRTKKEYNLCVDKEIIVKWNDTSEFFIQNEKKKGTIKIIKEDFDNSNIKISGVEFEIIDKNNRIVEKLVTNKDGEAVSSKLPIGEYKIKETNLGKNTNYLLNEELYNVEIKNNEEVKMNIKNVHKKGNLKIVKVDKDNNSISLENVKFEIEDKDGTKYIKRTDKNGILEINNIKIGEIKIKEIETNYNYNLLKEIIKTKIEYNKTTKIVLENELKKGRIEVYKTDEEDSKIKIEGVEFEVLDSKNKVVDKILTNRSGHAISKELPIGTYYLKEVRTNNKYLLNNELIEVEVQNNITHTCNIKNKRKKGKIQIIKTSNGDSEILKIKKGMPIENIEFEMYNDNNELVDTIITNANGEATSKLLEMGRYKIKEKNTNKNYLLNNLDYFARIENNNEIKRVYIENQPTVPKINIEKTGPEEAYKNEEIKYEFSIKNGGNVAIEELTWIEYIPFQKEKITKMITGTYNQTQNYKIFYKTNMRDYELVKEANTNKSEYLDFTTINLKKNEIIEEIKIEYGKTEIGFETIVAPTIITKVNSNLKEKEVIVNKTSILGKYNNYDVKNNSIWNTVVKEKRVNKKLPRTGK